MVFSFGKNICGGKEVKFMVFSIKSKTDEFWWGGAVSEGIAMPFGGVDYELDCTVNRTSNQFNALFVSNRGRYIYVDGGCIVKSDETSVSIFEPAGEVDFAEGFGDLRGAYRAAAKKHFFPSENTVPECTVLMPQYNSWVEMLRSIDQEKVLDYAEGIIGKKMPAGILILDDGWMTGYGEWTFHPSKFPAPEKMMKRLHELGFKVILWICPFVDKSIPSFSRLAEEGLLLRRPDGSVAERTWWNGESALLDMTNPKTRLWLKERLELLMKNYGVDGFKFDAGDPVYYSEDDVTFAPVSPNGQSKLWAEFAAEYEYAELRACVGMGGYPIIQRLSDKNSCWGNNGIASLIPNMIQAGLLGYPYCCPDMVGGGQEAEFGDGKTHDDELMARSCECAAFMPMIQFSYAIWERCSNPLIRKIARDSALLRLNYRDYFRNILSDCVATKDPMMRNMEYEFPGQGMEKIKDQFMLGGDLLVAPVLEKGATTRDVVLPRGCRWKYVPTGEIYEGGDKITVDAPLEVLPYFEKSK